MECPLQQNRIQKEIWKDFGETTTAEHFRRKGCFPSNYRGKRTKHIRTTRESGSKMYWDALED